MSPTRKPKPPDKGAPPEHKPSRKVALEEVMRSLQDLVSNELAIEPAKQAGEPEPGASSKARTAGKQAAESTATLPATEAASAETVPVTEFITLESLPDLVTPPPSAAAPEPPATPTLAIPAGGLQQELPYLDALSPELDSGPPVAAAELSTEALVAAKPSTAESVTGNIAFDIPPDDTDADIRAPLEVAPLPESDSAPAPDEEINWDDVPVLEEAVDMPEEIEVRETGLALDRPAAANLPPADAARRLAIQVAARLNVELRKSGQGGLSSDIITRLARLLQEALAKGAPNMENSPPDKH